MPKATITSKNQITLPKEVRSVLGVAAGDQVEFRIGCNGGIAVLPAKGSAARLFGMIRSSPGESISVEQMDRSIADAVTDDDERIRANEI